jgi:hypothetical protein
MVVVELGLFGFERVVRGVDRACRHFAGLCGKFLIERIVRLGWRPLVGLDFAGFARGTPWWDIMRRGRVKEGKKV